MNTAPTTLDAPAAFRENLSQGKAPMLALAPMQDVTDLPFWRLMSRYGGPDVYYTEYFRVHPTSTLEREILRSVTENPTGKPIIAQMIGSDIPSLVRAAKELQRHPIAAIDLNLGCPAPIVYRKCAGGGLLRDLHKVDAILGALRQAIEIPFTVKTRIGFENADAFDPLLGLFEKHRPDLVTVHGRTVGQMYRSPVRYDLIKRAVEALTLPVLANGDVDSPGKAVDVLRRTGSRGLMVGRGAIRNPWIFEQTRSVFRGEKPRLPTGKEVSRYIAELYHEVKPPVIREVALVQKMKKYMNYLGLGVDPGGGFLYEMRRASDEAGFFAICSKYLDHDEEMTLEPFATLKDPGGLGSSHTGPITEADQVGCAC